MTETPGGTIALPMYAQPNGDGRCIGCDGTTTRCRVCHKPHASTAFLDHEPVMLPCRECNGGSYPVRPTAPGEAQTVTDTTPYERLTLAEQLRERGAEQAARDAEADDAAAERSAREAEERDGDNASEAELYDRAEVADVIHAAMPLAAAATRGMTRCGVNRHGVRTALSAADSTCPRCLALLAEQEDEARAVEHVDYEEAAAVREIRREMDVEAGADEDDSDWEGRPATPEEIARLGDILRTEASV